MSALLTGLASFLAPIILNLIRGWIAQEQQMEVVEVQGKIAEAEANAPRTKTEVDNRLRGGTF